MPSIKSLTCKNCNDSFFGDSRQMFCSKSCANKARVVTSDTKQRISKSLSEYHSTHPNALIDHTEKVGKATKGKYKGKISSIFEVSPRTARKILGRIGLGCSYCGWNEELGDIHHIKGRKIENFNSHENLCYLCPNCHRLAGKGKIDTDKLISLNIYWPENWKDYYYG